MKRSSRSLRARLVAVVAAGAASIAATCDAPHFPMFHGDWIDAEGEIIELMPGVPQVLPGPDGEFETADDVVVADIVGDLDIVLRTGMAGLDGPIPDPSAAGPGIPRAWDEVTGEPLPVPYVVTASDGTAAAPYGNPVASVLLDNVPVLVAAFADLDGDGYIGVTHLDGDPLDFEVEENELIPVGKRYAFAALGVASGELRLDVGGPPGAEPRVALVAMARTRPTNPGFLGGEVPIGPGVTTKLPFLPEPNVRKLMGGRTPEPATTLRPPAVELDPVLTPNPTLLPQIGEIYTVATDGSEPSLDLALVRSGPFSTVGLARVPTPEQYVSLDARPLRPGFDDAFEVVPYEVLRYLSIPDDGDQSTTTLRVVPLDRSGNIAQLANPADVTLRATGALRIVAPDIDNDTSVETLSVLDTRGVDIAVDDRGGVFDDPNDASLVVESAGAISVLQVVIPDPDTNDDGVVDNADRQPVDGLRGVEIGEPEFEPDFDVDGDGRILRADSRLIQGFRGLVVPVP